MYRILILLLAFMGAWHSSILAQTTVQDTITRSAPIFYDVLGNKVSYGAKMPELNQVAGAPKAFYTYYWEMGDGDYSFEKSPNHTYKKDGTYEVKLWSTNNYDNGKPPASRPKKVTVAANDDEASLEDPAFAKAPSKFKPNEDLRVLTNRDPLPSQEMVLVTSYKNTKNYVTSGKLYLYYNDKSFKTDNFKLTDTRLHHNENISQQQVIATNTTLDFSQEYLASNYPSMLEQRTLIVQDSTKKTNLPLTLEESEVLYRNKQVIEFTNMQPGEERNIFRTLETTPEMIKDTSAIVTLRSVYVPDEDYSNHTVKDTELEIVTSHDPNKMSSNGSLMNYRLVRFKRLKFKVKFQNDGEGPANTIRLETDTPEMFDKSTLRIEDMYPACPICPKDQEVNYSCLDTILKKEKIIFTFKRIYLPGTQQKDVTERDSTKGFVKYSMKFGKDFHKEKTKSRTAIYFDKNEPIYTNYSRTRFVPGISIGAKAGTIFTPSRDNNQVYFAGITISPFKSYKWYLQSELFFSAASFETLRNFETSDINEIGIESITRFTEQAQEQRISTYLVPISFRYNLNNFIAIGTGPQLRLDLSRNCDLQTSGEFSSVVPGVGEIRDETQDTFQETECSEGFGNFQAGWFVGANIGGVRIGPSGGVRYVYNFNDPQSQIQVYGIWKF